MSNLYQNKINHIVLLLDASTSMKKLRSQVVEVVDNQIAYLAQRSKDMDQETRVSIYTYGSRHNVKCVIYDKDVLRLPSIAKLYTPDGQTALRDAQILAIDDLRQTPEKYGDHAFLLINVTDGEENDSSASEQSLVETIDALPENYTLAVLVPDQRGVFAAKKCGFPAGNIAVWDINHGFDEAASIVRESTETFMTNRSRGVRGTKSLFKTVNVDVSASTVRHTLEELAPILYRIERVFHDTPIREFVEEVQHRPYYTGQGYYELSKTEEVQDYKQIALLDNNTCKLYTGPEARGLLGIPDTFVKLKPGDFKNWTIFIQSTSVNRKLIAGTRALILSISAVDDMNEQYQAKGHIVKL